MGRLAWSQLRFQAGRALALLVGMLVATTAFTVLTAAARAAQVRTIGTVNAHFQPSYDILIRPAGARSSLEEATGTVQPTSCPASTAGSPWPSGTGSSRSPACRWPRRSPWWAMTS